MSREQDDIKAPPPLSQDTPPHPWTPSIEVEEVPRGGDQRGAGATVAGSETPAARPRGYGSYGPPWMDRREMRRRHGAPILGPVLLIAAGVVFLLNQLNVLPWSIWGQLWRLWPLVLVAIGLDMLIGRRNPAVSMLIVLAVLAAGIGLIYYNGGFEQGNLVRAQVNVPKGSARSADVMISVGTGNLHVDGKSGGQLLTGTLEYFDKERAPRQDINSSGDAVTIRLEQLGNENSSHWFDFIGSNPKWDLHFSPDVAINLTVNGGTSDTDLDLSNLNLSGLRIDNGTGDTTLRLPMPKGAQSATLNTGTGDVSISLPPGAAARIRVQTGTGDENVDSRFQQQGSDAPYVSSDYESATNKFDLTVETGTGDVDIR